MKSFFFSSVLAAMVLITFAGPSIVFAPAAARASVSVDETAKTVPVVAPEVVPDERLSNCWLYVKSLVPTLPNTKFLTPGSIPHIGSVAIFNYPHYALVIKLEDAGFWVKESNFGGPGIRTRLVAWNDKHLTGFWSP